ncbi:hypothetical protein [Paenibacillus sp. CF384]|uniref:hypothetical protein n=1 Tax=Paenibacillus sp. CF384 TaxID=1884382 RepID=UPI00089BFFEA|nr:hypothetical protein [Paenibacillus sp. CF384]SDW27003.1 hypothetical protein SAMN05518855_1001874 [Paenibacillus sp. CF384]
MPFKPIDFQISIPRTPENSLHQQQLNQRPVAEQMRLENDTAKQTELLRNRNTAVEQNIDTKIKDNRQRESQSKQNRKKKQDGGAGVAAETDHGQKHPYKGNHIDISM